MAVSEFTKGTKVARRLRIGRIELSCQLTFAASRPMPGKTLLVAVLALLGSVAGVAAAPAMPLHPASAPSELIIPVGSGCGLGVRRGPYGECNVIYGGHYSARDRAYHRGYYDGYRQGYYDGTGRSLMVDQGACSGYRMVRVCNIYGSCWAACE
jgi:hypothetical protein